MSNHEADTAKVPARYCPRCKRPLDPLAAEGLCAPCLMERLLDEPSDAEEAKAVEALGRFGDYELLELIARGGMGTVYRARHSVLNRIVALKLIPGGAAAEPGFLERFETEARAAASLDHPHIVPVYEYGECDGVQFLTMKFIEGGTLAAAISQRTGGGQFDRSNYMGLRAAAQVVVKVSRAVHFAHQRGVLHRDIKPGNILLDGAGEPHLVDFGLAKLVQKDSTITRSLAVLGTPAFMSPEQAAGRTREITTAADVYGLGALLYCVSTGVPPFAGGTTFETIGLVLGQDAKPPSQLNGVVDRDLETICLKCLEKEPSRRYGSAEALADDLQRWLNGEPVLARPAPPLERMMKWGRRHRARAAILGTVIVSSAVLITVSVVMNVRLSAARQQIFGQAESRRAELVQLNVATGNRLTEEGDGFAALKSFAEAARLDTGNPEALTVHRDRFALTRSQLPALVHEWRHTGAVLSACFSPDGRRIVSAGVDRQARIWNVADGARVGGEMGQSATIMWAAFSPDGSVVVTRTVTGAVQVWDGTNGTPVAGAFTSNPIVSVRDAANLGMGFHPHLPVLALPSKQGAVLQPWAPEGGMPVVISADSRAVDAFFSPDGQQVVVVTERDGALVCHSADGQRILVIQPGNLARNGCWSSDGKLLSLSDGFRNYTFDAASGTALSGMMEHDDFVLGSRFRSDGAVLLTRCYDNTARLFDPVSGRSLAAPLRHRGIVRAAVFSPDGARVLTASHDGTARVWNSQTGESAGNILRVTGNATDAEFSPDGETAVVGASDGSVRLWRMPSVGYATREWIADSPTEHVVFSPDSKRIACVGLSGLVHLWNIVSNQVERTPLVHASRALDCAWVDDRHLRVMTGDGKFREWDVTTGTELWSKPMPEQIRKASYTVLPRGGKRLLLLSKEGVSEWWDVERMELITAYGEATLGWIPQISASGNWVATLHRRRVRVWYAETGKQTAIDFTVDQDCDRALVSEDGSRVAVTHEYSASLWDAKTGKRIGPPMRHAGSVRSAAFTPDSRYLITASDDTTARVWDTRTGHPLGPPLKHGSRALMIDVRSDSRAFTTSCSDGKARLWDLPEGPTTSDEMMAEALKLTGEQASGNH